MNETYIRFPNFTQKALTFSYDDGTRQDKRLIEIMVKYGLKGTFNINSGLFDDEYNGQEIGRMTKEECLKLYLSSNMEVGIHGYKHMSLTDVDSSLAMNDIIYDRRELENMFGKIIAGMAYANGSYNDEVVSLLRNAGITYSRTTVSTGSFDLPSNWLTLHPTCHHNNPKLMDYAKDFVESKEHWYYWGRKLKLFYVWGHSCEFDEKNNWDYFEKFAEYVGHRDDIWYATNGEIYDYLKACESLQFSTDGSFVRNNSSINIYLDFINNKCVVPAGKTVCIKTGEVI